MLDYSRENVQPATMVREKHTHSEAKIELICISSCYSLYIPYQEMLFDLAGVAHLEQKRAAMAAGEHINTTEDRAVMHVALRAPRTKKLMVDGADVVPDVHAVLSKVR